jgi:hypothetical protein
MHKSSATKDSAKPKNAAAYKSASDHLLNDPDRGKGSQEPDDPKESSNNSMQNQLPHRASDPMQEGADSDFPEPGASPEHSFEGENKVRELRTKAVKARDAKKRKAS